ncbi:peptidoglycan recognition family protein [Streptomyces sp. ATE26]|uniref:N-acetylmuramoyl-L-alanine amidase n=1 Tax=Streptomyces sp. ATE26 TaxID=2954237 RepID=UPI0024832E4D|nr:peptidoglycan recognition family protein [Streptomyces sp. ATE26]MDI1455249.1 peptidoglycan recognition family protein [Streptomyces sp. ATE26]
MWSRVLSRVPGAVRGRNGLICATASAALLLPLLVWPSSDDGATDDRRLQGDFATAARDYHVPVSVLMGVSYLQSRWDSHPGVPSTGGGYGPMHLVDAGAVGAAGPSPRPAAQPARGRPEQQATDLRRAARLTGEAADRLRLDASANVRGGAALLAATQKALGKPLSGNPADWWDTVSRFSGSSDKAEAATYAHDVFDVIRKGAHRTTDVGQRVSLTARPEVRWNPAGRSGPQRPEDPECPPELSCSWLSASYGTIDDEGDYGNHDLADRPRDQKIEYIVIHDTEAFLPIMFKTVQDPTEASWHYSISSRDGHVTQHIKTKDEAWHSGNQFVNARSIGIEHEGFLTQPDAWFSEQMYRTSARLVRFLARKYGIPLDRQHIFGHDNVPAPTAGSIPDMHDDPGPFWDWRHYFDLLGAPLKATAGPDSPMVTVLPGYATHKPRFTGCTANKGDPCPPHGSSAVRLYTEPSDDAPLIQDMGRHPDGADSTEDVNDLGSRVSAGQTFAVAGRSGDWTAIWFQGDKAWFKNPKEHPTAVGAAGRMVTPKAGLNEIPVYGRALPDEGSYPEGVTSQPQSPLPYTLRAGQRYVTRSSVLGTWAGKSFGNLPSPVVKGRERYYEIQLGHRLAFVREQDVDLVKAPSAKTPDPATAAGPRN